MKNKLYALVNLIGIWLLDIIGLAWPALFLWLVCPYTIPFWKIWLGLYGVAAVIPTVLVSIKGALKDEIH